MEARKNNFTCYIPHNFGHHKSLQVWKPLPLVSVICGPLSGWVVDVTVLYLVVGLFLCFAFGYSKELGCVGKTHTLIFSQMPMILCSCIGLFHRHGKSLPQQVFKVKTNSHPHSFLPNFWQVLCKTWGPACFLKARVGTLNLIHNSGEKLFLHILMREEVPTAPWTRFWAA